MSLKPFSAAVFTPSCRKDGQTDSKSKPATLLNLKNLCRLKYIPYHLFLMIGYFNVLTRHVIMGELELQVPVCEVICFNFFGPTYSHFLLLAGIPTIIRPFFGDQFFWADRVEALGVGTGVRKLTVSTLSEALLAATTDSRQISRAKTIGEQIRAVRQLNFCIPKSFHFPLGRWGRHCHRVYLSRHGVFPFLDQAPPCGRSLGGGRDRRFYHPEL